MKSCKFCGKDAPDNMQGYCQVCYRYFVMENKKVYSVPPYGEVAYAPNGDCICPECGKAFRKLGMHIFYAHDTTTKKFFEKHGWHLRNVKATNQEYREYMREVQQPKCISKNLIIMGSGTRFNQPNGNRKQLPIHSMKSRCNRCSNLSVDTNGEWNCSIACEKCKYVMQCLNKEEK